MSFEDGGHVCNQESMWRPIKTPAPCARCLALTAILERMYPWLEGVDHVHLSDGSVLYASQVWDVLHGTKPTCPTCGKP
jgi:hypothetical protein